MTTEQHEELVDHISDLVSAVRNLNQRLDDALATVELLEDAVSKAGKVIKQTDDGTVTRIH